MKFVFAIVAVIVSIVASPIDGILKNSKSSRVVHPKKNLSWNIDESREDPKFLLEEYAKLDTTVETGIRNMMQLIVETIQEESSDPNEKILADMLAQAQGLIQNEETDNLKMKIKDIMAWKPKFIKSMNVMVSELKDNLLLVNRMRNYARDLNVKVFDIERALKYSKVDVVADMEKIAGMLKEHLGLLRRMNIRLSEVKEIFEDFCDTNKQTQLKVFELQMSSLLL